MIKRALISVSDKTGLVELGKALKHFQIEIISTGGTAKALNDANIETVSVSDYTGFPEMMEGRLKTLHPRVHGALLGVRDNPEHEEAAKTYGINWVDLVVVNLYPFEKIAYSSKNPGWTDLIENIDIGGPAMIRAAAKNHEYVTVVTDPKDYKAIIQRLKAQSNDPFDFSYRYEMARKAFRHTAVYDSVIAETLGHYEVEEPKKLKREEFPKYHFIHGEKHQSLRYGENPHQKAAAYRLIKPSEYMPYSQSLQGKELSFNNYLDADAAWKTLMELPPKSCVILKHNNPCGIGVGESESESFDYAWAADSESAFGGIVAISGNVDSKLAEKISENFVEIVCAESFGVEAREVFQKKKNLRLILLPNIQNLEQDQQTSIDIRKMSGSYLMQEFDSLGKYTNQLFGPDTQCVTKNEPNEEETKALRLAWILTKNVKSNSVVITNQYQSLGIGCGDVNRKFAAAAAAQRAAKFESTIRVCGSDGFFPFADSITFLKEAGVTAIVQPGGSIRDEEVIEVCNEHGISMLFTKVRHFRH